MTSVFRGYTAIVLIAGCTLACFAPLDASPLLQVQETRPLQKPSRPGVQPHAANITETHPVRIPEPEIIMVRSDARAMVFEYRPRYAAMDTLRQGAQEFILQDFEGSVLANGGNDVGSPDLRLKKFPVGVPSLAGNAVQVVASDFEEIRNVMYAPVPGMKLRQRMSEVEPFAPDAERYRQNSFAPLRIAALSDAHRVRNRLIADVNVFPLQYNPATRTLRRYTRIVVEVVFGAPAGIAGQARDRDLFRGVLLNDDVSRSWSLPTPARRTAALASSVLSSGNWYRMAVTKEGVYRLDYTYLSSAGINPDSIDPRTIRIFGNGGSEVPENLASPRPIDLLENAIYVWGEADGRFDHGDYVLFFGTSTRGWAYNPATRVYSHTINHYTETNYYWLTYGGVNGKRMADQPSAAASATSSPDRFPDHVFVEEEKVNLLSSGKDWYGQSISPNSSFTYLNVLPGLVPGDLINYRYALVSADQGPSQFAVKEWGDLLGINVLPAPQGYQVATGNTFTASHTSTLPDTVSTLNFAFSPSSISATGYVDWAEIVYPRMFSAINGFLRFRSPDGTNIVEYRLQNFGAAPMVMNVTSPANVTLLSGLYGAYAFRASEVAGQISEYCASTPASWLIPAAIDRVRNEDLRGYAGGADYIILTTPDFMSAANRLAAYRSDPSHGGLKTVVVDVNQVYNEFSGGLPDVSAIRDYLSYAYNNWTPQPTFVLMLGEGSYDYKGILGSRSSYVPTWQSPESRNEVDSYSTDDFFAEFGPGNAPSLVLGRISARAPSEADVVVDKIIRYESSSVQDTWKMRILFVGDDSWTSTGEEGTQHTDAAEDLAEQHTPNEFEKKKIYIAEYPTVWTTQGRRKPGAYQDIIDDINAGALMVNFTGHGNPSVWTHEHIFEVETSIPQLVNANRLSFYFLATCNFSQFDDPKQYTGSELLMIKPDGGSIGVIASTRPVYAYSNQTLNQETYNRLFTRDQYGRVVVERPAKAFFLYKAISGNGENDQKYVFMGDPAMRLEYPSGYASIDSVNHQRVDSVGGAPRQYPIPMKSLSLVTVSGTARDRNNQPDATFNGTVSLVVNDAYRTVTILDFYPGAPAYYYKATGSTIYHGENSVVNGRFNASFIVPRDVANADTTSHARLVGYLSGGGTDGASFTSNIRIGGTDTTVVHSSAGPAMTIYLNNRNFRTGDMVSENPVMYVDLADSVGINVSASGIGHRIEAWVNGSTQSTDLTDSYTSKLDDFRQGTVQVQLKNLPTGRNTVRVRAWDSFDNSATAETYFQVASSDQLTIADVMNYPNPFASETMFTFRQNQSLPLRVKVNVYTLAGRMIRSIDATTQGDSFVRIPWDGRDRDGSTLANGVYLYKVVVSTFDGRFSSEALGKLSVLK